MNKRYNLIGKTFGRLTIVSFSHYIPKYRYNVWNCLCQCGNSIKSTTASLSRRNRPTQSCGCFRKDMVRLKCNFNRKPVSVANINSLFYHYKKSANKRDIEFFLSRDEFIYLTSKRCFYCNCPPAQVHEKKETNGAYMYNGIDRKDNNIGYLLDNCVSCCKKCNYAKRNMTVKEFKSWIVDTYIHFAKSL